MPTREQLESALRNADAAGDASAAKQLANALKAGMFDQPTQFATVQSEAPQERPQITGGRGIAGQREQQAKFDEQQALKQFEQIQAGQLSAANLPPEQVEAIRKARINALPELQGLGANIDFGS